MTVCFMQRALARCLSRLAVLRSVVAIPLAEPSSIVKHVHIHDLVAEIETEFPESKARQAGYRC